MNDFPTLTDAFTELERRADLATSALAEPTLPGAAPHRSRHTLVAASAVGVLAATAGVAFFASNGGSHTRAGAPPMTSATHSSPVTVPATFRIPQTPAELARRFRVVLGDAATFTVTDTGGAVDVTLPSLNLPSMTRSPGGPAGPARVSRGSVKPNGAAIVGRLTAAGASGGFDLQIFHTTPGKAWCDDPDRSHCTIKRLADGSSLAIGREPLQGAAGAVTYQVNLIRADGAEFLMHVSNQADPKGTGAVLAAQPPLTTEQMAAIVTSDRW